MSEGAKIRVLLVDEQCVVTAGCRALLEAAGGFEVAGEADSGESALKQYGKCNPDVVVMELALPGMGGLETIRRLTRRNAEVKILVFSQHEESVFVERALRVGARAFVSKRSPAGTLIEAVRTVSEGKAYFDRKIAQRLAFEKTRGRGTPFVGLSTREFEVFCLVAEGLSGFDIAARLSLSYKTVANYTTEIKNKLGVATAGELTRLAIRHGVVKA